LSQLAPPKALYLMKNSSCLEYQVSFVDREVELERYKQARYVWTEELNRILREGYRQGGEAQRSAVNKIERLTGWPKHACYRQAASWD